MATLTLYHTADFTVEVTVRADDGERFVSTIFTPENARCGPLDISPSGLDKRARAWANAIKALYYPDEELIVTTILRDNAV